ncbi:MAG: hypothetical protein HZA46_08340 [Planctomycetales bacterium]|nr:hypothetical protein [Planctomycetales bacterium]
MSPDHVSSDARPVIRGVLKATPLSAAVAGVLVWCVTTEARAQAPGDKAPVLQVTESESTHSTKGDSATASPVVSDRQRKLHAAPVASEVEIWRGNRTTESKVKVIEMGRPTRNSMRQIAGEARPKVIDVGMQSQQKAAAKRLVEEARQAAIRGDIARASNLARRAADIPATWDLTELTPERLLRELEVIAANQTEDTAEPTVTDLPISETSPPQPLRGLVSDRANAHGGWSSTDGVQRIPTEAIDIDQEPEEAETVQPDVDCERVPVPVDNFSNYHPFQPAGTADGDAPLSTAPGPFAAPAVIDVRVHDFNSSSDNSATPSTSIASLILINLASALFGGLVVLVGVLYYILRKFGPRPEFVVKVVEVAASNGGSAGMENVASAHSLRVAPITAMRMQRDEEFEHQREDAGPQTLESTQSTAA